ncbi:SIMPL domain-containing protein [Oscillatoria sp. FACHB-1407]|uniref:SIMPL domain-containing protein n=1 Tax=Oscillatoria sp. FACHB-1407 TaxID=2692847 RepID=UPI0016877B54|nr:SIMPL domain-containing protein [Oscillatoria sp. FACHB-1407]MBD2463718.1 SIMPL domain-containing protein [Oscillatoria sp. FACHB-1407]
MPRTVLCLIGLSAIAPLFWLVNTDASLASSRPDETQIAQLFYPPANARTQGVSVMGHGTATAPADTAKLQLFFTGAQIPDGPPDQFPPTIASSTLTPDQLQPLIDDLVAAGVPADAIALGTSSTQAFFFFNVQGQQMTITLTQPTSARVQELIKLVEETVTESDAVALVNSSVQYFVNDCQGLASQAYTAAIADAQSRARAIATQLGVELDAIPSVAESPFSMLTFASGSTCDAAPALSLPFNINLPQAGSNLAAPAQVQLRRDLLVTFTVQN